SLRSRTVTRTSANGLDKTTAFDLNGDGVVDEWLNDITVLNPDGTSSETITETYADGTLKNQVFRSRDAGAYDSFEETDLDTNGDGNIDRSVTVQIDQDGYRTQLATYFNPNGTQKRQIDSENSPDGLSHYIFYGGSTQTTPPDEQFYFIPNANGSYLWNRFTATTAQTATHTIDLSANVDHWVWADQTASAYATNPVFKTLTIDLATEEKLIDVARRLYDTLLDRTMAQFEVQVLPKYISSGGVLDVTTLVNDVMATSEFTSKYGTLSNLQFVERIYQNALNRAPSLADLQDLVGQLNAGTTTRAAIVNLVSESTEHLVAENVHAVTNNTESGDPTFALDHTMDEQIAGDVIRRLYDAALNRPATDDEVTTQSQKILSGAKTEAQVAADILALPEFASTYGTLSNSAFVSQIFMN